MESKPQQKKNDPVYLLYEENSEVDLVWILVFKYVSHWIDLAFQLSRVAGIGHGELHTSLGPISFCVPPSRRFHLVGR